MALIKYCAGFAALLTIAAAAPTPQFTGGIQNDVVNVVKTDTDVDVDYDHGHHDHYDDHHYEHYHNVDPDPLHHVYYETGHWDKRNAAPQVTGGIQNDVTNVVKTDTDVDVDVDYDDHHGHHDHYDDHHYDHYHNVDPDPLHHVYYENGHWHKRDAAPQFTGGIQNDVTNVVKTDTDVDVDYEGHHGHHDHHDYDDHFDYWASQDPDPKHEYYPDGHWHKE
jgi:hypothetical protein